MIQVILPCCKADESQAMTLLSWIGQMGKVEAPFFLLCDSGCQVKHLLELAERAFTSVKYLPDYENILSDWNSQAAGAKSAAGPNSLFRQALWHFASTKDPWLFLEPDAIPCRPDWLALIDKEYHSAKKPFMGFNVNESTHPGVRGQHMSGVAVYPANSPAYFRKTILASNVAFDIAIASSVMEYMHDTKLIFHRYRPPTFADQEDFEGRVTKDLAIYHSCKDGSIYPFLRYRLGLSPSNPVREVQLAEPLPSKQIVAGSSPVKHSTPVVDIFIKTRPHDYPWLEWCRKSIRKFANGFRLWMQSAEEIPDQRDDEGLELIEDKNPGYLWQQVCKLYADETLYTDSEYILYMDSDCVFTRPVTPSDFIKDGKPIWLYTPLDRARSDQHVWIPVMEKFLGKRPEHEFMRRHPFIVPRWALERLREFCQIKHGKTIEQYIMGEADPNNGLALRFSEWNCLGFFLWEFHRDKVHWVLDSEADPACVYQGFTHGGEARKQEDIAKFKEILEGSTPFHGMVKAEEVHLPPPLTIQTAIEFLASQAKDNPMKARIVRQLKQAWKGKGIGVPKKIKAVSEQLRVNGKKHNHTLLCIHSYPGANEAIIRHWPNFCTFGADRIMGIGTTDGKCEFPGPSVNIGENAYMKTRGKDDHLCRRLLDTVKWCLTQPEDRFAIIEYDTLILRKFPKWEGVNAFLTGGPINGSKANQFFHNPWLFDRDSGTALVQAMEAVLPESDAYPDNSPDLFFGLACERAGIKVKCNFKFFTRNSLDLNGDLELAVEAAISGVHAIHGVKHGFEYETITRALNGKDLELSHAQ